MAPPILNLIAPGGFANAVGHYVAALDIGLAHLKDLAADLPAERVQKIASAWAELESAWIHDAVGHVPTPQAPADGADREAWLAWLDAVRTVSLMVLRPLQERDLERLIEVSGEPAADGPRTLRRVLAELLFLQGTLCGGPGD